MKKFAIWTIPDAQPEIVEGISAVVTKTTGGLKIKINLGLKKSRTFTNAIAFTEVCPEIKIR
jgi:hypothetical protein